MKIPNLRKLLEYCELHSRLFYKIYKYQKYINKCIKRNCIINLTLEQHSYHIFKIYYFKFNKNVVTKLTIILRCLTYVRKAKAF